MIAEALVFLTYYRMLGAALTMSNCFLMDGTVIKTQVPGFHSTILNRSVVWVSQMARAWWFPNNNAKQEDPESCKYAFDYLTFSLLIVVL